MPVWSYLGICWKNLQDTWERLPMSLPGVGEFAWWWHRKLQRFPVRLVLALKVNKGTLWSQARSDGVIFLHLWLPELLGKKVSLIELMKPPMFHIYFPFFLMPAFRRTWWNSSKQGAQATSALPSSSNLISGGRAWVKTTSFGCCSCASRFANVWKSLRVRHHVNETNWSHGWNFSVKTVKLWGETFSGRKKGWCHIVLWFWWITTEQRSQWGYMYQPTHLPS